MSGIRIPKLKADPIHIPLPKQVERPFKDRARPNRQQLKRQLNRELTERLDRVASEVEQDSPVLALAIDKISDHLEQREACENPMLIDNSLMKIDKDLKNMKDWFQNIEVESLRGRLESIHRSLSKHVEEIKEQFKR